MFGQLSPPEGLCQRDSHLGVIRAIDSFNVVCSELYKNVVLVAKMTTEMIFHCHLSPANLDPPLERRRNSHISSTLSVAARWWPSVKLTRCRRLATETLWAIYVLVLLAQTRPDAAAHRRTI
jgi:hypothetical protein